MLRLLEQLRRLLAELVHRLLRTRKPRSDTSGPLTGGDDGCNVAHDVSTPPEPITLRQFFIELLLDGNLDEYHNRDLRADYIERSQLSDEHKQLLREGALADVEQAILEETHSPAGSKPILIVTPP